MILGARQGAWSRLRRLAAYASAQTLEAIVVPGPEVAGAYGLDLEGAGIVVAASPRHAGVLVVVGPVPAELREAATVLYAGMMRPRIVLALGAGELTPLPEADVAVELSQQALLDGVHRLRTVLIEGAFHPDVIDFDALVLHGRTQYTCPMHPEVVRGEPGSCPKCGMTLVPHEVHGVPEHADPPQDEGAEAMGELPAPTPSDPHGVDHEAMAGDPSRAYTCPMHPEVVQDAPGSCPKCGMTLVPREAPAGAGAHGHAGHGGMEHAPAAHTAGPEYTCPMHPEVVQDAPGSCPKCGMTLVLREAPSGSTMEEPEAHSGMDHARMGHGDRAFMSMVAVTRDLPRSADGLPMDWIEVPFGPLFPGLPGGLLLMFTLDGDAVAKAAVHSLVGGAAGALQPVGVVARDFARRIGGMDPLAPAAYRLLACRALEDAAGQEVDPARARARAGTLERERIASHLGWLGGFARQLGIERLARRASALQAALVRADSERIPALGLEVRALVRRIKRTPLLRRRLAGIGRLPGGAVVRGPVARAAGRADDARSADATYGALGFEPVVGARGDAFDRLQVRLGEIVRGLELIRAAGTVEDPGAPVIGTVSGTGAAAIETPRGVARLRLTLEQGRVVDAQLDTPSNGHLALVGPLVAQQELGDALIAVGSLDLSPWEAMG